MRIVMLSDFESFGGAAIGASRLAQALVEAGEEVIRIVGTSDGDTHPWETKVLQMRRPEKALALALKPVSERLAALVETRQARQRLQTLLAELTPDVINIHNLHGAGWRPNLISVCARHAPTVWTLQDMWSFTGRCAYSYDCRKFLSGCDASCPTPEEYPALAPELIARAWELRRRLLAAHPDLVAVCLSNWLAREALEGLWKGHRIEVIPNGVPLEIYKPLDKDLARAALGIDTPGPVLLMSAYDIRERRKGGAILVKALRKTTHRPLTLVLMGHGSLPIRAEGIHLHPLGYVDHERTKRLVYNAADLFVHPAPVEAQGQVIVEAMACGTPVVGFPIGGVLDMVRPGQTGWLADAATPKALARTIDMAIQDVQAGVDLRSMCRAMAKSEFGVELQTRRYLELFQSLCS